MNTDLKLIKIKGKGTGQKLGLQMSQMDAEGRLSSDTKVDPRDDTNIDPLVGVNPMGCPERRP